MPDRSVAAAIEAARWAPEDTMHNKSVQKIIAEEQWSIAEEVMETGPCILRFRHPILEADTSGYDSCVRVVWIYDEEGSGALPAPDEASAMLNFEDRMHEAVERDLLAVLVAVLTFDGARQWVFYTLNEAECAERIIQLTEGETGYALEIDGFSDPEMSYLKTEILAGINDES